jgi:O-acetyl-ADP-ribose deacetylase (regulator of RNase III)
MSISIPKLILVDPKPEVCSCWKHEFRGLSHVAIVNGRFEELEEFDCMVSAANSFGLMDGGVDLAIICYFGIELMDRVQERVIRDYLGEQPVGTSIIVETGSTKHPFIAHTPTVRVRMSIATTDYVFSAMWAMLVAVHQHNRQDERKIRSIACPGLGTSCGMVAPEEAARQMALAYRWSLEPPTSINWALAKARQGAVGRGGDLNLRINFR